MDSSSIYYRQVQLLIQLLPFVAEHKCFALKGGTAINLFVRDLPRLSVDIDLVYLPMKSRDEALDDIRNHLDAISASIVEKLRGAAVTESYKDKSDALRLIVSQNSVSVKIELSPVLRGTIFKEEVQSVCDAVEDEFGFSEIQLVSFQDLYAGKLCAALDRQHPRDLFDIGLLLENEGITDELRKAFIVYLISHGRPMHELLKPKFKDIKNIYEGEFLNMTEQVVPLVKLEEAREEMVKQLSQSFTDDERKFMLSFKSKKPDWNLLGLESVKELPAIKWKLLNLSKMSDAKHQLAYSKLAVVLEE